MKRCRQFVMAVGATRLPPVVAQATERVIVVPIPTLPLLVVLAISPGRLVVTGQTGAMDHVRAAPLHHVVPVARHFERSLVHSIGDQGRRVLYNGGATVTTPWLPSRESAP
jgi:hypothetical protein